MCEMRVMHDRWYLSCPPNTRHTDTQTHRHTHTHTTTQSPHLNPLLVFNIKLLIVQPPNRSSLAHILKSQCPSTFTVYRHDREDFWECAHAHQQLHKFWKVRALLEWHTKPLSRAVLRIFMPCSQSNIVMIAVIIIVLVARSTVANVCSSSKYCCECM